MVVAVPSPLVDTLPLARSDGPSTEDRQISRLLSDNPMKRSTAAVWLKENGDSQTAARLEGILIVNGLQKEVKRCVAEVLTHLSFKHMDFCKTRDGEFRRKLALASALPSYRARARC